MNLGYEQTLPEEGHKRIDVRAAHTTARDTAGLNDCDLLLSDENGRAARDIRPRDHTERDGAPGAL